MPKLNVLLITSDQQHWNTLGQNNPEIQTPALDKLAAQGTTFTRAYCPNPTCTPTRSSMITGKYPSQHGAYSLGTKLPETEPTVGERFQDAGYRTSLVGKAHFQPLQSTEEYPSLEAYPKLQDLDFWTRLSPDHSTDSITSSWRATIPTNPMSASTMPSGWKRRAWATGAIISCSQRVTWRRSGASG